MEGVIHNFWLLISPSFFNLGRDIMDDFKTFLETSSIGGLNFISRTRRFGRVFWILVVLMSLIISFIEISNLFYNWHKNPIITTSENLPISDIQLPEESEMC